MDCRSMKAEMDFTDTALFCKSCCQDMFRVQNDGQWNFCINYTSLQGEINNDKTIIHNCNVIATVQSTVEALKSSHLRNSKKVVVTGAGRLQENEPL